MTYICVSKLTIIGSDNGLSPGRRQAIIWTNGGILLIGTLGTNFCEILIEILTFSFKKMHLKISSAKWRPFCFGLNVLKPLPKHNETQPSAKRVSNPWNVSHIKIYLIPIPLTSQSSDTENCGDQADYNAWAEILSCVHIDFSLRVLSYAVCCCSCPWQQLSEYPDHGSHLS